MKFFPVQDNKKHFTYDRIAFTAEKKNQKLTQSLKSFRRNASEIETQTFGSVQQFKVISCKEIFNNSM